MNQLEHDLQVNICKYLDFKKIPFFAIPNGGQRHIGVARKLKAEGVKAGVADLFVMIPNSKYNGLFIEVKVRPNSQQQTQKDFEKLSINQGYAYKLVYSLDELVELIEIYTKIS